MKIQVTGEVGREVNPFHHTITGSENHEWIANRQANFDHFERTVQSFPAPGIEDGPHEAELVWQWEDIRGKWRRLQQQFIKDGKPTNWITDDLDTRQIWKLTPKAK